MFRWGSLQSRIEDYASEVSSWFLRGQLGPWFSPQFSFVIAKDYSMGFPGGSVVKKKKNPPSNSRNTGWLIQSLGWEDLLEKKMAIHSSILTWEIPWTDEPGGLQSIGFQRVRHDWATEYEHTRAAPEENLLRALIHMCMKKALRQKFAVDQGCCTSQWVLEEYRRGTTGTNESLPSANTYVVTVDICITERWGHPHYRHMLSSQWYLWDPTQEGGVQSYLLHSCLWFSLTNSFISFKRQISLVSSFKSSVSIFILPHHPQSIAKIAWNSPGKSHQILSLGIWHWDGRSSFDLDLSFR